MLDELGRSPGLRTTIDLPAHVKLVWVPAILLTVTLLSNNRAISYALAVVFEENGSHSEFFGTKLTVAGTAPDFFRCNSGIDGNKLKHVLAIPLAHSIEPQITGFPFNPIV